MLTDLCYPGLKADDAEQALAVIRSGVHIDVLFTDVVMPGRLRSRDMARQAASMLPHLKILFTSGYTQNAIGGRLDPGVELLSKPYSQEELAHKLRRILGASGDVVPATEGRIDTARSDGTGLPATLLHILVVEDDSASLDAVCEILRMLGHEAAKATDATHAMERLRAERFDGLMTDLNLHGACVVELA
jgi:CheY-like chemotaxis protein